MKSDYIEEFPIPHLGTFLISKSSKRQDNSDMTFSPWFDGCCIHTPFNSLSEVRKYIFDYAIETLKRRKTNFQIQLNHTDALLKNLGDDVFNLAKYKE